MRYLFLLTIILLNSFSVFAQLTPRFNIYHTDVTEFPKVRLHYTAHNKIGFQVNEDNITVDHFSGTENGVDLSDLDLKKVCGDLDYDLPMSVVLVLDATLSMQEVTKTGAKRIDWVKIAANRFNDSLKYTENSATAVVSFASTVHLSTDWLTERSLVKEEIDNIDLFVGNTNFNPSFQNEQKTGAIDLLKLRPADSKRVIIFLTDGLHTNQKAFDWENIKDSCLANDIVVYSVALDVDNSVDELRFLSDETGGEHLRTNDLDRLTAFYDQIYLETQSGKDKCWLEYTSTLSCIGDDPTREVNVDFNYFDPAIVNSTVYYDSPNDKLISINSNKDELYFDTKNGGLSIQTIQLTSLNGSSNNLSFSVIPDDGNFTVDFTKASLNKDETTTADITFLNNGGSGIYELTITSDNCPSEPITLIAPCGGDVPAELIFQDVASNSQTTKTISFTNNGDASLTGQAQLGGTDAALFEIISGGEEFTLQSGESHDLTIRMNSESDGDYSAHIDWVINQGCGVPRTSITANVVSFGVEVVPYDFGMHRVGTTHGPQTVYLRNIGSAPITVTALAWEDQSLTDFTGLPEITTEQTLAAGDDLEMNITFSPSSVGFISNTILVSLKDSDVDPKATISGTGTLPQIEANDIDFPDTDVDVTSAEQTITIVNNSTTEDLYIDEIKFEDGTNINNEFSFANSSVLTDITIPKDGGTHEIYIDFTPASGGQKTARVEFLNNTVIGDPTALDSYFVNLSGVGIGDNSFDIPVNTEAFVDVFSCGSETKEFTFVNTSDLAQDFNVSIQGNADLVFGIDGPTQVNVAAGATETISITFYPKDNISYQAKLVVETIDGSGYGEADLVGNGASQFVNVDVTNNANVQYEPNQQMVLNFSINIPEIFIGDLDKLEIKVVYNNKQLDYIASKSLILNNDWNVNFISNEKLSDSNYELVFEVSGTPLSTPNTLTGQIAFSTLLHNVDSNPVNVIVNSDLPCLLEGNDQVSISVDACVNELFVLEGNLAGIEQIAPNPVDRNINLKYHVPVDGANTKILVYDQIGNVLLELANGVISKGTHDVELDISKLNSGVYYLYYDCEGIVQTQGLIVNK